MHSRCLEGIFRLLFFAYFSTKFQFTAATKHIDLNVDVNAQIAIRENSYFPDLHASESGAHESVYTRCFETVISFDIRY